MNVAAVEAWLQSFAGLESASIGADAVARAAQERIAATGCASVEAYLARLENSAEERTALIDRVVVPETWFFRDRPALDALAKQVVGEWGRAHPRTVFRVLSVPCSTGEEPYSLAMAFALAGWPLELLRIDAVDISRQNLERAARGIYGRNSFRGADLKFRTAFLEVAGNDTWRVSDRLRAPITFEFGNLLADDFAAARRRYDAIFCRNLLIYFDRATQARAVGMLDRLLAPEGWFAVGPAEPTLLFAHGYELVKVRSAFLLRRPTPGLPSPLPPLSKRPPAGPTPPVPWREVARPAPPEAVRPAADQAAADAEALSEIQQLADAGRLREARTRGEALLARRAASAPLLFLLGVVAEASGDTTRAEELFRKTIYLDPTHTEALGHLATRAELNGDRRAAHTFRERAQRALKKEVR
jgi:chemotaxis protein methyltransferase WspC